MYNHLAVATGNTQVYLAGQVAWDENGEIVSPGDLAGQVAQVLRNVAKSLRRMWIRRRPLAVLCSLSLAWLRIGALLRQQIARRVERGVAEGDVGRGESPDRIAEFLMAVLTGMSARAKDGGSAEDLTAIVEFSLRALPM